MGKKLLHWSDLYIKLTDEESRNQELIFYKLASEILNHVLDDYYVSELYETNKNSDVVICFKPDLTLIFTNLVDKGEYWVNPEFVNFISNLIGYSKDYLVTAFIGGWFIERLKLENLNFNKKTSYSGITHLHMREIEHQFKRKPTMFKQIKDLNTMKISETKLVNIIKTVLKEQGFIDNDGTLKFGDNQNDTNYELVTDYIKTHKVDSHRGSGPYHDYYLPLDAKEYFDFIGFKNYEVFRVDNPDHEDYGKKFVEVKSWII
jgi:hypothetical protein